MDKEKIFKDVDGNLLEIGDRVGFTDSQYTDIYIGRVIGFTPKMVKIAQKGKGKGFNAYDRVVNKPDSQITKLINQEKDKD